jgi:hypothetical protein
MLVEAPSWAPPVGLRLEARWFPCLGAFPQRALVIDSDRLELGDGALRGVVFQQGSGEAELCVFAFEGSCLDLDLTITGSRPVALLFRGSVRLGGAIDARRAGARRTGPGLAATPGGGGGFGGRGGAPGGGAGAGGPSYGLLAACEIGSGGQAGSAGGGVGGGGLQIGAEGRLELAGAWLDVSGAAGTEAGHGTAGGGGSGGSLVLHGREVRLDGATTLSVRGGDGGAAAGSACGGGGGGGGYILGLTEVAGRFDPRGARFLTAGGRGGMAGPGNSGGDGGRGVVFLAGKRDRGLFRDEARAEVRSRAPWIASSGETTSRDPDHPARSRSPR